MKLSFSTNAFRRFSLLETLDILAEIGYQGVEIMADIPHAWPPLPREQVDAIGDRLRQRQLAVANINAFMTHAIGDTWHPSWIEDDPDYRRQRVDHTGRAIELAAALGCPTISTEPGGPPAAKSGEEALALFRAGLATVQPLAKALGVRVLIEPEPELLIENSRQFLSFIETVDQSVFGLNFDIGHFFCVGEDPAALIRQLAPWLGHVHLEDIAADRRHHHLLPGRGAIEFAPIFAALADIGYQGFVTIELYPYEDKPVEAARAAYAAILPYL
ncbi:MAG: sugar phosphate isomerase/epimerase [Thermodesulfobacteriota bacterium]